MVNLSIPYRWFFMVENKKPKRHVANRLLGSISSLERVMTKIISRAISLPIRESLSFEERWRGEDRGLILCWEIGRQKRSDNEELAKRAEKGELPVLGWKGGIEGKPKMKRKFGSKNYLAQWQGLRGEDLYIDLNDRTEIKCSESNVIVTFTYNLSELDI
jgi:hypothetical protein